LMQHIYEFFFHFYSGWVVLLFILKMRDFHPPPEDCRHSGVLFMMLGEVNILKRSCPYVSYEITGNVYDG
jgi:hypothetical protein